MKRARSAMLTETLEVVRMSSMLPAVLLLVLCLQGKFPTEELVSRHRDSGIPANRIGSVVKYSRR